MKRPVGVILSALVQILGSLFVLLLAVMVVAARHTAPPSAQQPPLPPGVFLGIGVFYLICAGTGIATAVGLLCLKNWSRCSTLVFGGILVSFGLLLALVFAVMPLQAPPQAAGAAPLPANFAAITRAIALAFALAIAALGAGWLYYFNRKTTRAVFLTKTVAAAPDPRPLSIVVLAVLSFLAIPSCLFCLWRAAPIMFLGTFVDGTGARLLWFVFLAVSLYTGLGLLRLNPSSRYVAIGLYLFGILNTILFYLLPGREERIVRLYARSQEAWHLQAPAAQPYSFHVGLWAGLIGTFLFSAVALCFLVAQRGAFQQAALPAPPPPQPPIAPT